MCGRFTLRAPASVVAEQFSLLELPPWKYRYNIAPSQPVPVIRLAGSPTARREITWLRWGLVPSWADDPAIGNRFINARAETAADKPAFRQAFRRRRCLVVADGFYEWQRSGKQKQPYLIALRDGRPFAFAGLWEMWEGPGHSEEKGTDTARQRHFAEASRNNAEPVPFSVESCTLLTTAANDVVRPIHDRMPVILAASDYERWLDPAISKPELLLQLLRPYPSESMRAYAVSPLVNSPANDDPRCAEPV